MANSSIVGKAKNAIIRKLIQNEDIVKAINATNIEENDELINTHIFNYDQNPNTINDVLTFIIVLVHIPKVFDKNKTFLSYSDIYNKRELILLWNWKEIQFRRSGRLWRMSW